MLNIITYYLLAIVWFKFLVQRIILTRNDDGVQFTAYNSKYVVLICGLLAVTWILSIPFYVLRLERV